MEAPPYERKAAAVVAPRAREGDAPSLGEIVEAHGRYVVRALRCLGVPAGELDDAFQEVFLVAHRRRSEWRGEASLRTWLYAICVRRAQSVRRDRARSREDVTGVPPELASLRTPEDDLDARRALDTAVALVSGLDAEKRVVFVLYEVEQLPMNEVASIVGCPAQTAYARLYAARRELAKALARLRASRRLP